MPFCDIVGHNKQLETLRRSLENNRLHHAYLFFGPEGVGKKTVALSLAKAIHCGRDDPDLCNGCVECARIDDGNHPDVRVVTLLAGKKEITIQQVREVETELKFRSFSGRKKVVIVDPATLMNRPAQNALLKTLEEPPPDSLLILISSRPGELLPTLRSRCLALSFGALPPESVQSYLTSKERLTPEEAKRLAGVSLGSLGKALRTRNDGSLEKGRDWAKRLVALSASDYSGAVALAEELAGNREECLKFLEWAESWFRDLLVYSMTGNRKMTGNLDTMPSNQPSSTALYAEAIAMLVLQAAEAAAKVQRNVNRRMVLEDLLFGMIGRVHG